MNRAFRNTPYFIAFVLLCFQVPSAHTQTPTDSINAEAEKYIQQFYDQELVYLDSLIENGYMKAAEMMMRFRLHNYFPKNKDQHKTYHGKVAEMKTEPATYQVYQSFAMGDVMARANRFFVARSFYAEGLRLEDHSNEAQQKIDRLDALINKDTLIRLIDRFPYLMYYNEGWEVRNSDEIIPDLQLHCERDSMLFNGVLVFQSPVRIRFKPISGYTQELHRFENGYPTGGAEERTYAYSKVGSRIKQLDYAIPLEDKHYYLSQEVYRSGDTTFTKRYFDDNSLAFLHLQTDNRISQISWNENGELIDEYQWESNNGITKSKDYLLSAARDTLRHEITYRNQHTNESRYRKLERNRNLDTITYIVQSNDQVIGVEYRPLLGGEQDHSIKVQWESGFISDIPDRNVIFVNAKGYIDKSSFINLLKNDNRRLFPAYSVRLDDGTKYALLCALTTNNTEKERARNQRKLAQIEANRERIVKRWLKKKKKR